MRRKIERFLDSIEREPMGDDFHYWQFPQEH
jgi:hypothetical protein